MAHRWTPDLERKAVRWHTVKTTAGPDPPDPPDPPGPGQSYDVYLRIEQQPDTVLEGEQGIIRVYSSRAVPFPVACAVVVTGGTATDDDFDLQDSQGNPPGKAVFVVIPANQREDIITFIAHSDDAAEGIQTVDFELDPDLDISGASGASGLIKGFVDAGRWGAFAGTIEIDDQPVAPPPPVPKWRHVGDNPLVLPEESGINQRQIGFSIPTEAPISIRLYTTDGTAIAGVHYFGFDRTVEVPIGTTLLDYAIWIINDQMAPVGPSLTFTVTGEIVLGVCDEADVPVLEVEIFDDDTPVGVPDVQFTIAGDTVVEPQTGQPTVVVNVQAEVTQPFAVDTDVPVTIVNANTSLGVSHQFYWSGPTVQTFRFLAGESFSTSQIEVLVNGMAVNGSVELTLVDGAAYDLGAQTTYTLTILEGSVPTGGNQINVQRGLVTGRSCVQGIMAVVPPSPTLPRYRIVASGEDMQVFGHARDSAGNWRAVWVVGFVAGDLAGDPNASSFAYEAGAIQIEAGAGAPPAEDGSYPAFSLQNMVVRHMPCNTLGGIYERDMGANLAGAVATSEPQQCEGPSGALFTGVGPDLRQTFYFRVWLKLTTNATADVDVGEAEKSTRCCEVELWATYTAGTNVVIVEGRFANDTYKETLHPVTGARTWSSGEVNTRLVEIDLSAVDVNWAPVWGTQNPLESWNGGTRILTLLPDQAEAHLFAPNAEMGFRFALYDTTDGTAQNMAIRMLRFQHHFVAVGPLSPCSNPMWEDSASMLVDHGRAGFSNPTFGQGWRGIFALGENRAAAMRSCVAAGDNSVLDQRYGWMQTEDESTRAGGAQGGKNLYGVSCVSPSAGWFEHVHAEMIGALCRVRLSCMDPYTGRLAWDHVMVETFNGSQTPLVCGVDRSYHQTLPVFNRAQALVGQGSVTPSTWARAPETGTGESRAWNGAAPDRLESSFRGDVDHDAPGAYERHDMAHVGRLFTQLQGAWWGCRSFLARRGLQSVAAAATRGFSCHEPDPIAFGPNAPDTFAKLASSLWYQINQSISAGGPLQSGSVWFGRINPSWFVGWGSGVLTQTRAYAWGCRFVVAAFISADAQTRAGIANGFDLNNWFTAYAQQAARRATQFGLFAQCTNFGSPNPYSTASPTAGGFGPTDIQNRTGAIPGPVNASGSSIVGTAGAGGQVPPYDQPHWTWEATFQAEFMSHAVRALCVWTLDQQASLRSQMQRMMRRAYYTWEAHNASRGPLQGFGVYPRYTLGNAGLNPFLGQPNANTAPTVTPNPEPFDHPPTLTQYRAGATWWNIPSDDSYGKVAMTLYAAYQESSESDKQKYLRPFLAMLNRNPPDPVMTQQQIADAASFVYGILRVSSAPSGGSPPEFYGEQTFLVPYMALLLSLVNP